ncbi:MAG: TVP38/TMEM64 family protein [Erysipelotrichaceae bacterium]|nr:TVP38/TMEM64 family protein [Erysipelotrichaceae bacterium]
MNRNLTIKQQKAIYIGGIALFAVLILVLGTVVGKPLLAYVSDPEKFVEWIDSFGIWSRLIFIVITALQVIIAVIPGEPFEVAGGYAFGLVEGTLLCLVGITLGCMFIFSAVRYFGQDFVRVFFKEKEISRLSFLKDPAKLNTIAFAVFVIPGTPKDLLSYFIGLTGMKFKTWILLTFFARIPSVLSSTYRGAALGDGDVGKSIIIFAVTAVLSTAGMLGYNYYVKKRNGER